MIFRLGLTGHRSRQYCGAALALSLLLAGGGSEYALAQAAATSTSPAATVSISLNDAIQRAQANEPAFAAIAAETKATQLDRSIAKAALLPSLDYHNQFLYTQPNGEVTQVGGQAAPRFIANNAVHEYTSQATVNETLGLQGVAGVQRASAASARAAAELEVARRGLVSAVVGLYFGVLASERKLTVSQRAAGEADAFTNLAQKREAAREVAHADVVKAELQQQQRQRDLADAQLAFDRSRLELGILLFPDPRTSYTLQAGDTSAALPTRAEVEAAAGRMNPELKSALALVRLNEIDVLAAKAAYMPDLALNFTYGIDAPQFAVNGPDGIRNLGYSASATLDIPVWNWLSTQNKVKQSQIRRDAARVALTATQKRLIVALDTFYAEAVSVRTQLASLDASVQTAAESLRLTRLRYTGGEATVLEVVDAENALTGSEIAREDGLVRYQAALANLQTLTGTL
ncbi:outer membrane protein TolC [Edaphobacter aggregans]|uniref:Outer membrane protein TolC n=1 Tax=Edaphobacter aggregans TaxID=570835 RepID=A0A3R9P7A5_9BACT|nr:outer membrane protein TolC [Edaphobacter aggregans]